MIIKSIYIGDMEEAFIYKGFKNGINIIFSDDNNKGKTILIQSIMYCLGNIPVFPKNFEYQKYYYVLHLEQKGNLIKICRRDKDFIIKKDGRYYFLNSISEFKNYWNKNIEKLPKINKNGRLHIVNPELYLQLYFIGQDKKMTDNIVNGGFYKKNDFYELLYSMAGIRMDEEYLDKQEIKISISKKNEERKLLLKENKILKDNSDAIKMLSYASDRRNLENKLKEIDKLNDDILELKKERNRVMVRKSKNEKAIEELRSLNRTISVGRVECMDCGSNNIVYNSCNSQFSFDISTTEIRNNILESISEKIDMYSEEVDILTEEINKKQKELKVSLEIDEVSIEALLIMKKEMDGTEEADKRIIKIEKELKELQLKLDENEVSLNDNEDKRNKLIKDIVEKLNDFNKFIDHTKKEAYDDIFTKRSEIYSGSEATEFQLARLYAFQKILNHNKPIIVDSFRAEDLSSEREDKVLELYKKLENQIIFTTTLKREESNKYNKSNGFNNIDFSINKTYKMLSKDYLEEFKIELEDMMVSMK
ncbi:hypothetical protein [Tissierella sp.]|uniref:hypothetical protein n=1 Tax=Tissierella sp. TaxID=41274 RepID=UPI00303D6791